MNKRNIYLGGLIALIIPSLLISSCTISDSSTNSPILSTGNNSGTSSTSEKEQVVLTIKADKTYIGPNEYIYLTTVDQYGEIVPVIYSTSDSKIATVSSTGTVKGISLGQVTITATSQEDASTTASIILTVGESLTLDSAIRRLFNADSYQVTYSGRFTYLLSTYKLHNIEEVGPNEYYFDAIDEDGMFHDIGYASRNYETFEFTKTGDEIAEAKYLREYYESYKDFIYLANEMSGNYYSLQPDDNGVYDITGATDTELFFNLIFQNATIPTSIDIDNLLDDLHSIKATVLSADSFKVTIDFDGTYVNSGEITIEISSLDQVDFSYVDEYLKSHEISTPSIEPNIERIMELIADYNYISDLGSTTIYDENDDPVRSIDNGNLHFTKDYLYFNYSDEYLEYINSLQNEQELIRGGYINLDDGVYTFTVDENDEVHLDSKWSYTDEEGKPYSKYYEYYPNITIVMNMIDEANKLYSFIPFSSQMFSGLEYASNSYVSLNIAAQLDSDALDAGGTPYALCVAISKGDTDSSTAIGLASCFQFEDLGGMIIPPMYTTYTDFGNASITFLDDYLLNR